MPPSPRGVAVPHLLFAPTTPQAEAALRHVADLAAATEESERETRGRDAGGATKARATEQAAERAARADAAAARRERGTRTQEIGTKELDDPLATSLESAARLAKVLLAALDAKGAGPSDTRRLAAESVVRMFSAPTAARLLPPHRRTCGTQVVSKRKVSTGVQHGVPARTAARLSDRAHVDSLKTARLHESVELLKRTNGELSDVKNTDFALADAARANAAAATAAAAGVFDARAFSALIDAFHDTSSDHFADARAQLQALREHRKVSMHLATTARAATPKRTGGTEKVRLDDVLLDAAERLGDRAPLALEELLELFAADPSSDDAPRLKAVPKTVSLLRQGVGAAEDAQGPAPPLDMSSANAPRAATLAGAMLPAPELPTEAPHAVAPSIALSYNVIDGNSEIVITPSSSSRVLRDSAAEEAPRKVELKEASRSSEDAKELKKAPRSSEDAKELKEAPKSSEGAVAAPSAEPKHSLEERLLRAQRRAHSSRKAGLASPKSKQASTPRHDSRLAPPAPDGAAKPAAAPASAAAADPSPRARGEEEVGAREEQGARRPVARAPEPTAGAPSHHPVAAAVDRLAASLGAPPSPRAAASIAGPGAPLAPVSASPPAVLPRASAWACCFSAV